MDSSLPLLGTGGIIFVAIYISALLVVGWIGRQARQENTLSDFYLAGRHLGLVVLLLTLYASQYSGLTLIGFAGSVYRSGYVFLVSITFALGIVAAYLVFAPKLYRLSRRHGFVTAGDFLQHRYGSPGLVLLTSVIFLVTLANYILTNLKAIGHLVESTTGGTVPFVPAIIAMSLIMVAYESLGGMRSVAWTDAIQGTLLLVGCVAIFGLALWTFGGPWTMAAKLQAERPDFWQPPDLYGKLTWLSTIALVFFGPPIYPHAVQRIYAASDEKTLRRSLQLLLLMPFVTTLPVIFVALIGAAEFTGLDRNGSETILFHVLTDMGAKNPATKPLLILFVAAALAAIMSTLDSALLALSAIFTKDIYARFRPGMPQAHLTFVGKLFSWVLMFVLVYFACNLPQTLWRLTEIKLEILCQAAPAIFLGLHIPKLNARSIFAGIVGGMTVFLALQIASAVTENAFHERPFGIHAGAWGLATNFFLVAVTQRFSSSRNNGPSPQI